MATASERKFIYPCECTWFWNCDDNVLTSTKSVLRPTLKDEGYSFKTTRALPIKDASGRLLRRFELATLLQRSGPRLALQNGPVFTILHCIDFRIYYTLRGISIKLFWIFLCKNLMNPSQKCSFRKCLADLLATFFVRLGKNTSKTSLNTDSSNSYLALRENNIKLF